MFSRVHAIAVLIMFMLISTGFGFPLKWWFNPSSRNSMSMPSNTASAPTYTMFAIRSFNLASRTVNRGYYNRKIVYNFRALVPLLCPRQVQHVNRAHLYYPPSNISKYLRRLPITHYALRITHYPGVNSSLGSKLSSPVLVW